MKNVCRFAINSEDIIKKVGLDPDTSAITKIESNDFDGNIIFTIKSSVPKEGVTFETSSNNVRIKKLEVNNSIELDEFLERVFALIKKKDYLK